jgi:ABC-2 type transport system permease protein
MNSPPDTVSEVPGDLQGIAPELAATRPLYWSVRRELWENRSITIAPLIVTGVFLFGFLISTMTLPRRMHAALALDPAKQRAAVVMPYSFVAALLILTAFIVGAFYCLDALHSERRDRSILFWKSLPVSDRTTVLAKASIPLVVLPMLTFVLTVSAQLIMLLMSTAALAGKGPALATLWSDLPLFRMSLALVYGLITIALWHAPIYAWLLLVSGWARHAAFIWAILPLAAINIFERIAFRSSSFCSLLQYRLFGWFAQGFVGVARGNVQSDPLMAITPGRFLSTPGVWIGLALAAVFLAAAVRLRRARGPI